MPDTHEQGILSRGGHRLPSGEGEGALRRTNYRSMSARRAPETELREVEHEAENIKRAVRHGYATATLLEMLEATEAKIKRLRAKSGTEPAGCFGPETLVRRRRGK